VGRIWACLVLVGCFSKPDPPVASSVSCESLATPLGACVGNLRECDGDPSIACETDIMSDRDHCGACGQSCAGGTCSGGVCRQVQLVQAGDEPLYATTDGTTAFWAQGLTVSPAVMSVPLAGGPATALATDAGRVHALAIDETTVYFVEFKGIWRIRAVPKGGGPTATIAETAEYANIAIGPDGVYWIDDSAGGRVAKISLTGGVSTELATGQGQVESITVDDEFVFWTSGANVNRAALDGSDQTVIVPGANARSLLNDGDDLLWADEVAGTIMSIPRRGGTPTLVASTPGIARTLQSSGVLLYWIQGEPANGTLWRLARCPGEEPRMITVAIANDAFGASSTSLVIGSNEPIIYRIAR
jgi:hypothetical protein